MKSRLSYANAMSTLAVVVALGTGGAYAATALPVHSVGTKQLANSSVTSKKVADGSLKAKDFKAGQLPAGAQGPKGEKGDRGLQGIQGIQGIQGVPGAPAGAYLGTVANITIPATAANTCFKASLTEPGINVGDTVLVVPDYNGGFPIAVGITPGIATVTNSLVAQFCNNSSAALPMTPNQKVAFWRLAGPTP